MNATTTSFHGPRRAGWLSAALAAGALGFAAAPVSHAGEAAAKDIVDTAVAAGTFKTLVAALQAADLVGALQGEGPFTVFAPTDDAFARLPAGTLDSLLKPENKEQLKGILLYHVVSGKIMGKSIKGSADPSSLQGGKLHVEAGAGGVRVNAAKVTTADIKTKNGVIHVIDTVLLPPAA